MDIKFTKLYPTKNALYGIDEDGQVWELVAYTTNEGEKTKWVELPHAKRTVPEQKNTGNIVKPLTPDEIQDKAYKEAQDSVTSELKEYEH